VREVPIILNPIAGGGRLLRHRAELDAAAHAAGVTLGWRPTSGPGHATEIADREAANGADLVLAFGGDGTYNEVARGLLGTDTSLAVLPGGTTSVLVYEFGIPRSVSGALACLLDGEDRVMRPGRTDRGEMVLLMVSAGPDSRVLEDIEPGLKRLGGRLGVAAGAVRELLRRRPMPRFEVRLDGEPSISAGWAIIGRSRCYAGPFHATPGADPFGGPLEVVLQLGSGRWRAMGFAAGLPWGRHVRRGDVRVWRGTDIELRPADPATPVAYQIDGDPVGHLPVRVSIDSRELKVRVPRGTRPARSVLETRKQIG
jgi:diacylglycerol kinase family enzyme